MKRKHFMILLGVLSLSLYAGCGNRSFQPAMLPSSSSESASNCVSSIAYQDDSAPEPAPDKQQLFAPYIPYGMTYDSAKDQLFYNGKLVRWFEDYYPIEDEEENEGIYVGTDFFCEDGVVDVYATRDLTCFSQNSDGSQDPSGTLTGLKEFSQEDFDARDVEAIKNPPLTEAIALEGGELTEKDIQKMAEEYLPYGITYHSKDGQWYYNNEKINYFLDVLTSNGAAQNSGNFQGSLRSFGNGDNNGGVNLRTIRDFSRPNADGNGTLIGIEPYIPE